MKRVVNSNGNISLNTLASSALESNLIKGIKTNPIKVSKQVKPAFYGKKPRINLDHIRAMTTDVGIVQFANSSTPNLDSGFTLDDNSKALIALCDHYKIKKEANDLKFIRTYINFILKCQRDNGLFMNYVDKDKKFTELNNKVNLEEANGRAIWALGYAYGQMKEGTDLDITLFQNMEEAVFQFMEGIDCLTSPRALGFIIKGLYFINLKIKNKYINQHISNCATKLANLYDNQSDGDWLWFEPFLNGSNSVLPEALLHAWKATGQERFKVIAKKSFDFLLAKIFDKTSIKVLSHSCWILKGADLSLTDSSSEQPVEIAYVILALKQFHLIFPEEHYDEKMETAFSWFMGNNQLSKLIYNYDTGGCHDGLENQNVIVNQGAESSLSYLMARFAFEEFLCDT